jgi:hypothetical protein
MRSILHVQFGEKPSRFRTSDSVARISPGPQLPSNSVKELEAALIKARDAWRASRGEPRRPFAMPVSRVVHRHSRCR